MPRFVNQRKRFQNATFRLLWQEKQLFYRKIRSDNATEQRSVIRYSQHQNGSYSGARRSCLWILLLIVEPGKGGVSIKRGVVFLGGGLNSGRGSLVKTRAGQSAHCGPQRMYEITTALISDSKI